MSGQLALAIPFMDQPHPLVSWALAGLAVVIIGIAKSGFGSGVGIMAVPMFVFAFGAGKSADAMGALLPLLIAADVLSVLHHWGTWDKRNLKVLAPGSLIGIGGGGLILWWLIDASSSGGEQLAGTKDRMEMAIGVICLLYVAADLVKARLAPRFHIKPDYLGGSVAGVSAGIVTTIAHAAGPIITIYLLGQRIAKQKFIGTAVIYFFTVNVIKQLTVYPLLGLTRWETLWPGLWLLPLVPVGTWLGVRLSRVLSEELFRGVILLTVFASGLYFLWG